MPVHHVTLAYCHCCCSAAISGLENGFEKPRFL